MIGRTQAAARGTGRRARRALTSGLALLDGRNGNPDEPLAHPPLFVVGAPRSGSTLLYQLAVQAWDVTYLSNRHCAFAGAPHLVERLTGRRPPPVSFESEHGRTEGPRGPSECGEYWYRFFRRRPQHVPLEDAEPEGLHRLRASVRALGDASRRPIVFKNLVCSLRLGPLAAALPEALFVVVRRELVANAASLLAGRYRRSGDYGRWWSAEPPGIERLRALPPHEQVVEQVRAVEALIRADAGRIGEARFLVVRYEDICADTHGTLGNLLEFARLGGIVLRTRGQVPAAFSPREAPALDDDLRRRLVEYVEATTPVSS